MKENEELIFKAWAKLIRTQQRLLDAVEDALKESSLPPLSWYDVLLELNREKNKCLRLQDIGARILLTKNNVTRLIDRLEQEKLVARKRCPQDGRGVFAHITPEGQALLKKMWPVYRAAVQAHFGRHLTEKDLSNLIGLCSTLQQKD